MIGLEVKVSFQWPSSWRKGQGWKCMV